MNITTVSLLTITQRSRNKCLKNLLDFILHQTYNGIIEWIIVEGSKTEKDAEANKEFIINEIIINEIIINEIINKTRFPIKYIGYKEGSKLSDLRNRGNDSCKGDIIVCMDDDDYYPPKRVETAVTKLNNSTKQIAGCSYAYMYHYNLNKLYKFKSFGRNHSTNNCFAYKKEYLLTHRHDAGLDLGEETSFTNGFTEPMIQLDSEDCIVISSHRSNTFDKTPLCIKENNQIREILNNNIILPEIILKIKEALF
jgi:glycosyltransferase involved in cell wall biosynthesis